MASNLPDLQDFSSYDQIQQAVNAFIRLIDEGILTCGELATLAVKLARQIFEPLTRRIEFERAIRDDKLEKGTLNLIVSFFPAYGALAKNPYQIEMVQRLFQMYEPFSITGIIRPSAIQMLLGDSSFSELKQPPLYDRKGLVVMYPSHYGYVFGSSRLQNPTHNFLSRKNGLERAIAAARDEGLPLRERVVIEADIHRFVGISGHKGVQNPLRYVEENTLPISHLASHVEACMTECLWPKHPEEEVDRIAKDLKVIPVAERALVFEKVYRASANMIQTKRPKIDIKVATRNLHYLFSSLKPLGFDPLTQARDMGGAGSEQAREIVTALYDRAYQIRSSEEDDLVFQIAWLDAIFLTLKPEWVMAQGPSAKAVAYLYSLTEDEAYRSYLKKFAEGCEALLPGDLGL